MNGADEPKRLGRELHVRRYARDEAGLVDDLRRAGFSVTTVEELQPLGSAAAPAVPILIDWLGRTENRDVVMALVRMLGKPWAKPLAGPALIEAYNVSGDDELLRWTIASSLANIADDSVYDDLLRLFDEPGSGRARQMLAEALGRLPKHRDTTVPVLLRHLTDGDINGHIVVALRQLRADVPDALRPFTTDERAWVRAEARKALARLE